jgi:predicted ATP-binding protein involved in virulence
MIELDPKLTVLVAENGGGKTALLDALRISLSDIVPLVGIKKKFPRLQPSDIRIFESADDQGVEELNSESPDISANDPTKELPVSLPLRDYPFTSLDISGVLNGHQVEWGRSIKYSGSFGSFRRRSTRSARTLNRTASELLDRLGKSNSGFGTQHDTLPLVAYYGSNRLFGSDSESERVSVQSHLGRGLGYYQCLSPNTSYGLFSDWYGQMARSIRDPSYRTLSRSERPEHFLTAVRNAVSIALEPIGWGVIDWEFQSREPMSNFDLIGKLVVENPNKIRLPLSYLSDGVRNMTSMVADLAHRCIRLNPHFGAEATQLTPGIVMIDEVDLHLHPTWQQMVIELLQRVFPRIQLVLTTHSPQVLTTIRKENIRVIEKLPDGQWRVEPPKRSVLAQESGDALSFIMGTNSRPRLDLLDDINRYEQFARQGRASDPEASAILRRLDAAGFEFSEANKVLFAYLAKKSSHGREGSNG